MKISYLKEVLPLWASIAVAFSLPIIEAIAVERINLRFLAYLGMVVPLATIVATSARIFAQSDVYSSSRPDVVSVATRTTAVGLLVYLPAVAWLNLVGDWSGADASWRVLLTVFLFSSVLQAPRFVVQAMAAGHGTSRIILSSSIIMVAVAGVGNLTIVLLFREAEFALAASVAVNIMAVIIANAHVWRLVGADMPSIKVVGSALMAFDPLVVRTIFFAVVESLSYNALFFVFASTLLEIDADSASRFGFISSMCLLAVSWRLTFSILGQSVMSRQTASAGEIGRLVGLSLLHVVVSLALIWWFVSSFTEAAGFGAEFVTLACINVFGTFNQLALAGLRARNAMGRIAILSMASNAVAAGLIIALPRSSGIGIFLTIVAAEELVRAIASSTMLGRILYSAKRPESLATR